MMFVCTATTIATGIYFLICGDLMYASQAFTQATLACMIGVQILRDINSAKVLKCFDQAELDARRSDVLASMWGTKSPPKNHK